jgi:hypothetical protein
LVERVVEPASVTVAVKEGLRRLADGATGRVARLTEKQYPAAVR